MILRIAEVSFIGVGNLGQISFFIRNSNVVENKWQHECGGEDLGGTNDSRVVALVCNDLSNDGD